jgi:hypothetical protein
MKWVLFIVGGLVLLVVIVAAIGATLPRTHTASRTLRVRRSPQEAWTAIAQAMNTSDVAVDIVESDPPRKLVSKVKETEKMFGGTWTSSSRPSRDIRPIRQAQDRRAPRSRSPKTAGSATPIFRFVSRFVMGHHATLDGMLKSVAKQFGEEPSLSGE